MSGSVVQSTPLARNPSATPKQAGYVQARACFHVETQLQKHFHGWTWCHEAFPFGPLAIGVCGMTEMPGGRGSRPGCRDDRQQWSAAARSR